MIFYSRRGVRKWVFRGLLSLIVLMFIGLTFDLTYNIMAPAHPPAQVDVNYYFNVIGDSKQIALTFDDGPFPGRTEAIMKTLKRENVPATFFFIGSRALRYPSLVNQASDNGFEVGDHTFTHAGTVHSSAWRLRLELNLTARVIETITQKPVRLYRPPFLLDIGSDPTTEPPLSRPQLDWATNDGFTVVGADIDPRDWLAKSSDEVVANLLKKLEPGRHLVLLHDGSSEQHTVGALDAIITTLRQRGYTFVTTSQLLGLDSAPQMAIAHDLHQGAVDTAPDRSVAGLQTFLIREGYHVYDATGRFGFDTAKALTAWQDKQNITNERGYVGSATRLAIERAVKTTTYQPGIQTLSRHQWLFNQISAWYIHVGPYVTAAIFWTVQMVLVLVVVRLILTLTLRAVAAVNGRYTGPTWRGQVSVVIPAYNEEQNIKSTILSVMKSSFVTNDVIVINDGSTDQTASIVKALRAQYPDRLRLVTVKNGGKAQALNLGIRLARHEIVINMDGDTVFDRLAISRLVAHFHDRSVGAVAGKVYATRSRNALNQFQYAEYVVTQNMDKMALNTVNGIGVVPGPVGAWRKSAVTALGGYSLDTLVEDQDLTLSMLAHGYQVVYEPRAHAYSETPYRVKDFFKQRSRWIFGTIQCLWKYKGYFLNFRRSALGWIVLPNTLIFTVGLSLMIPLMDAMLVLALIAGFAKQMIFLYGVFVIIDFLYAALAFWQESRKRWLLVLLPAQRLFFRGIIFLVVVRSLIKAVEGTESRWNKVSKRGDANAHQLQLTPETLAAQPAVTGRQSS